jgi:hypothetical protein
MNSDISEKSLLYPHIHTVTYGKWELKNDKYGQMYNLFKEYEIDYNVRGIL